MDRGQRHRTVPCPDSDSSGEFVLSAILGALVGGAIGGALFSSVSYVSSCAINDRKVTVSGLFNAAITGAALGAYGAAIGMISLSSPGRTVFFKGVLSAAPGLYMGIKVGVETEGSIGQKWASGISAGMITFGSTFLGSQIAAYDVPAGFIGNAFSNLAATLFVGVPAEILTVSVQQIINTGEKTANNSQSSPQKGKWITLLPY